MLYLTQLGGAAGGPDAVCPQLEANLAAMESALRSYMTADDTQQPFDVVSTTKYHGVLCDTLKLLS